MPVLPHHLLVLGFTQKMAMSAAPLFSEEPLDPSYKGSEPVDTVCDKDVLNNLAQSSLEHHEGNTHNKCLLIAFL